MRVCTLPGAVRRPPVLKLFKQISRLEGIQLRQRDKDIRDKDGRSVGGMDPAAFACVPGAGCRERDLHHHLRHLQRGYEDRDKDMHPETVRPRQREAVHREPHCGTGGRHSPALLGDLCAVKIKGEADGERRCGKLWLHDSFLFHFRGRVFLECARLHHRVPEQLREHHVYRYSDGFQGQGFISCIGGSHGGAVFCAVF